MKLSHYLSALRRYWTIVASALLFGLLIGGTYLVFRPTSFTATSIIYVSAQGNDSNLTAAYQGGLLSEQRIASYVELLQSQRVAAEVSRATGRDAIEGGADVLESVTAASNPQTTLISIIAVDESAEGASQLSRAATGALVGLISELERPDGPGSPAIVARVVEFAGGNTEDNSAPEWSVLAVAGFVGVCGGALTVFARRYLDTRIHSAEQLSEIADAPLLGVIRHSHDLSEDPLPIANSSSSSIAESFRQLRTNVQYVDVDQQNSVLVFSSSRAEEGKTTTVCNLAVALSMTNLRVMLIEADLRRPRAGALLGLESAVGLTSILIGRASLDQVRQRTSSGLDFVGSGPTPPNPSELLGSEQMARFLEYARGNYDFVLIDTPPALPVTDAAVVAGYADGVVLLVRQDFSSEQEVRSSLQNFLGVNNRVVGTVLTFASGSGAPRYSEYASFSDRPVVARGDAPKPIVLRRSEPPSPTRRGPR